MDRGGGDALVHPHLPTRYFALLPGGEDEYRHWWSIIVAGRMSEDIPGLNDWLRQQVERELA